MTNKRQGKTDIHIYLNLTTTTIRWLTNSPSRLAGVK